MCFRACFDGSWSPARAGFGWHISYARADFRNHPDQEEDWRVGLRASWKLPTTCTAIEAECEAARSVIAFLERLARPGDVNSEELSFLSRPFDASML